MMTAPTVFVGIDVAQATLAVAMHPGGASWTVPNDATGLATLQRQFQHQGPALIVLEATGGLERLAASTLDAQVRAHFAAAIQPAPRPRPDAQPAAVAAVLARRRQLLKLRTAEQNRLTRTASPRVRRRIAVHVRWLTRELASVDQDLDQALRASPLWRVQEDLLRSVPGGAGAGADAAGGAT